MIYLWVLTSVDLVSDARIVYLFSVVRSDWTIVNMFSYHYFQHTSFHYVAWALSWTCSNDKKVLVYYLKVAVLFVLNLPALFSLICSTGFKICQMSLHARVQQVWETGGEILLVYFSNHGWFKTCWLYGYDECARLIKDVYSISNSISCTDFDRH